MNTNIIKDYSILVFVISIVAMMVVPLPTLLLDILLMINLIISLLILLVAMNTKEPLDFAVFPSLLLIVTLFRLGLNVSTTRSILSTGKGGNVIETFGSFVVGGNMVVGLIVFLILVVIQFVVITKGAERVSEVSARFTLDAMPGKQMAIDADLNAGLINEQEARERRKKIENESSLYGAMDGATKFVKGDAIAGIIITLINIVGGLVIGMMMHEMSASESASTFTMLSVGDGLISQIPALLISTATGIMVTRVASEGNLGSDITKQLFAYPKLLYVVSGTLVLLGVFTPISFFLAITLAILVGYGGYTMQKAQEKAEKEEQKSSHEEEELLEEDITSPASVNNLLEVDPIELEMGYGLISLADAKQGGDLLDRVIMIRRQLAVELGVVVPVVRIRDNIQLGPNEYMIKVQGNRVAHGQLFLDQFLAMSPGFDDESIVGVEAVEPAFGLPALWITDDMREQAEISGYTVVDSPSVITTHLTEIIKRHIHEIVTRQDIKSLIDNIKEKSPTVVEELIPSYMSIGDVQKVLTRLLKEKVSIRNLVLILETLTDYAPSTKDHAILTEYVRQALSRQITIQYAHPSQPLKVISVSPKIEKLVADSVQHTEYGSFLSLDPESLQQLNQQILEQVMRAQQLGTNPIILSSPAIRMYFRQLVEQVSPDIPLLSYSELEPEVEVQTIGLINI